MPLIFNLLKDTMEACPYTPSHYNIISKWWEAHGWSPVPEDHLPSIGFIVFSKKEPIATGFLYKTDSAFGVMEWLLADKYSEYADRDQALDLVIQALFTAAKENNIKSIYTTTSHSRLKRRYENNGFLVGDPDTTTFTKRIE